MTQVATILWVLFAGALLYVGFGVFLALLRARQAMREFERYAAEYRSPSGSPQRADSEWEKAAG